MRTAPITFLLSCSLAGCTTDAEVSEPLASLVQQVDEPPGENCPEGGVAIQSGVDANRNGELDPEEVTGTSYVCHGADGEDGEDGATSLVRVDEVQPGEDCAYGGVAVHQGLDDDADGVLGDPEIDATFFVCDGAPGEAGEDGGSGDQGPPGENGTSALIALVDAEENCPDGGTGVQSGQDDDGDGVLDPGEVDAVRYVCDGTAGADGTDGHHALVRLRDEPPGPNCDFGGVALLAGLDANDDATLQQGEVTWTSYVCDRVIEGPRPRHWSTAGLDEVCHTPEEGYSTIPDLELDFELDDTYVVLIDMELSLRTQSADDWATVRLSVDGQPDARSTHTQASHDNEDDHMHLFRLAELGPGQHTVRAEWGEGKGTVCNRADQVSRTRELTITALPAGLGAAWGQTEGETSICRTGASGWDDLPGLSLDVALPEDSLVLSMVDLNLVGDHSTWTSVRLSVDDDDSRGTMVQAKGSNTSDEHASHFRMDVLSAGQHTLKTQWGEGSGSLCSKAGAASGNFMRRMGYLAIPLSTGVQWGYADPGTDDGWSHRSFITIDGLAYDLQIPSGGDWLAHTRTNVGIHPANGGDWAWMRLMVDGRAGLGLPYIRPSHDGEDDSIHDHQVDVLGPGPHTVRTQWHVEGTAYNLAGDDRGVRSRRLGTFAVPIKPYPSDP